MPNRVSITAARARDLACPEGKAEVTMWDTVAPGLGLRVRSGGGRTYLFQFRLYGKAARVKVGNPDALDIDDARIVARRLRVLVDQGIDPRREKHAKAEAYAAEQADAARKAVTLGELWPRYISARKADWSEHHLNDHRRAMQAPGMIRPRSRTQTVEGGLYALRDVRLVELTAEALEVWLREQARVRPTVTARNYRLLRAFLNWTATQRDLKGLAPTDATSAANVRRALPKVSPKSDVLQREQLKTWFREVRKIQNPVIAAYLQTLLLTGARREEIAGLRWVDVDFRWQSLTMRDKVEGMRVIPLTPFVAQLLAALPRRNGWVFSSPTAASGRLQEPRIQHDKALAIGGIPHLTIHGLRRTFGSLSEWVEVPAGIVAQIMGHKPSATAEKHYRVRPLDLLRMWHSKIEGWMLDQADIEQPAEGASTQGLRRVN